MGKGQVVFVEAASGRLYCQPFEVARHTLLRRHLARQLRQRSRRMVAGCSMSIVMKARTSLALVDVEGKYWPVRLVSGEDFYMQPGLAPRQRSR